MCLTVAARARQRWAATANLDCRGACRGALPVRAVVGCGGRLGGAVLGGTPRRSRSSASRTLLPFSVIRCGSAGIAGERREPADARCGAPLADVGHSSALHHR